ncbi:TRAP transporter small permease subunit [Nitratireductor aestuarii]|nr:TRAP transporter small permease subunit [Nitratireductor aestuarii]
MIVKSISALNTLIGNVFAWLSLAIVVLCFAIVVQRYLFSTSIIWMRDLYVWMNGALFTAVAGFALLRGDHVRVDILYRPASRRWKATVDLIGVVLFLLPFCWLVWVYGWPFVVRSWRIYEASPNIGGMTHYYILKTFILGFAVLVALQGIAMALRSVLVLRGQEHLLPANLRYTAQDEEPGTGAV